MPEDDVTQQRSQFTEVVTKWQERLLQLDLRNKLLNFKPGKTAVRIVDQTADGLVESLNSRPAGLTFDYAERRTRAPSPDDRFLEDHNEENPEAYVVEGDLKGDCPPLDLQRRLSSLRRRQREFEEEQGLNVLFLALGFLEWIAEDGTLAKAPLLLLPCDLNRASPRDCFTLSQQDDDVTTNSTLAVKLREIGIELPEALADDETPSHYLDSVRRLVANRPDYEVVDDIYLATFSFSKLAMWNDLKTIKDDGTDHPIVLSLASGGLTSTEEDYSTSPLERQIPENLSGGRLDDILDVKEQFAVLPADYSQLLAITAVRDGHNLVIHGPPGTGKSQTIANIIATLMAEGKSVLFVSEKTAALDVVKRRLDEKQLGAFCLDLHSERGKKASVYQQLKQSVDDPRTVRNLDFNYALLTERRGQLNLLVRALHKLQEPLGLTVFQVQGKFANLRDTPHVDFGVKDITQLDRTRLARISEACSGVETRQEQFREHQTTCWRVLKTGTPSLELANTIRGDMQVVASAVSGVESRAREFANTLGITLPKSLQETTQMARVGRHLGKAPGIPALWLQLSNIMRLRQIANREMDFQKTRANLLGHLTETFGAPVPQLEYGSISERLILTSGDRRLVERMLGPSWSEKILQLHEPNSVAGEELENALSQVASIGKEAAELLGVETAKTWPSFKNLVEYASTIGRVVLVPPKWLEPRGCEAVNNVLARAEQAEQNLRLVENRLFADFEPDVLEAVDRDMLVRYRTDHQSRVRRLIGSTYRSDQKVLRTYRRHPGKLTLDQGLEVVERAVDVANQKGQWAELENEVRKSIQGRYQGRETHWDSVRGDIADIEGLASKWTGKPSDLLRLLSSEEESLRCKELAELLHRLLAKVEKCLQDWCSPETAQEFVEGKADVASFHSLLREIIPILTRVEKAAEEPIACATQPVKDIESLRRLMDSGARLLALEREHAQMQGALESDIGTRFKNFETDWVEVLASLAWAEEFLEGYHQSSISDELMTHIQEPDPPAVYQTIADSISEITSEYRSQIDPLTERYDLDVGPWRSWEDASFHEIREWTQALTGKADSASDWLLYCAAVAELDSAVGAGTTDLIRNQTESSGLVPQIVERRVLGAWLDSIYHQEPMLARFTSLEQEHLINNFRQLDEQLAVAAQTEVRRKVFEGYPSSYATSHRVGELGMLRDQLSRRRRQWPVRRLFRTIPSLIQTIKPCFLMSPLAVSQYLPLSSLASETLTFDVVIFDEASQVFPEDAVPAILRGNHCVLAGDEHQLPPTNFFRHSLSDDDADYDDDDSDQGDSNQLADRESILKVGAGLVGRVFNQAQLNVHYRSKDESLIRFSNHHFYQDRLLTFPSPGFTDSWSGIKDFYVPDGRYDAGASRTNRIEAQHVVNLVFEHMRTRPLGESLGVVALSRPQADLIESLIDERRILERDVEERFTKGVEEPFFVKNLENVQGDERDHMIISIGYGPTVGSGAVPNRFGPLNKEGGERRLNVVITRAKQRVDVVHSLRATDIHSQQDGARFLRRYLEYAANPLQAFEGQLVVDPSAESESPFEAAVERALVAKGYRVARQVGVSGYRIDLAILSEDGVKCDLGIECDGVTYHAAPAARDRDWQRQRVLEGLGWKIHRVWSTAWARNPVAELALIEESLAAARSRPDFSRNQVTQTDSATSESLELASSDGSDDPSLFEVVTAESHEITLENYVQAHLPPKPSWAQLGNELTERLVNMIAEVAETEGPIHKEVVVERLRLAYGLGHVRGSTRDHVEHAIRLAIQSGKLRDDGRFLWVRDEQLQRSPRRPVDRNIEHVPPTELKAITFSVLQLLFGAGRNDLVVETARKLGFDRTGGRISEVLDDIVQQLLEEGMIVESFGMLHVAS